MENNHQELQAGIESLQSEFKLMHARMTEKFEKLMRNLDSHEKEQKEKGLATEKSSTVSVDSGLTQLGPSSSQNSEGVSGVTGEENPAYGD